MIKFENVSVKFENLTLFEGVNVEIPKNKITMLIGLNGSGKTSLLKAFTKRTSSFYLPQNIKYPQGITLNEYMESIFYNQNWKWFLNSKERGKISKTLELLELGNKRDVLIDNLSSGEIQKANIGLALLSEAKILLLDEPTSNLDIINQVKVLDILKKLKEKGITIVVAIHDINLIAKYAEYFIGITSKHKIITGDKKGLIKNLSEIYGMNFEVSENEKNYNIQISD